MMGVTPMSHRCHTDVTRCHALELDKDKELDNSLLSNSQEQFKQLVQGWISAMGFSNTSADRVVRALRCALPKRYEGKYFLDEKRLRKYLAEHTTRSKEEKVRHIGAFLGSGGMFREDWECFFTPTGERID
jgi:hypothetical protein